MKHYYVDFYHYNEETGEQDFDGKVHYTAKKGIVIDKDIEDYFPNKDEKGITRILAPTGKGDVKWCTTKDGLTFLKTVSLLFSRLSRVSVSEVRVETI